MEMLKDAIQNRGQIIGDDILKVDMFLNHQIDVHLLNEIGKEFARLFEQYQPNKILTIEASGIAISCAVAQYLQVPVVFAKKGDARNIGSNLYVSDVFSFTKQTTYKVCVSKEYLNQDDRVLIIDDFLANGHAMLGLLDISEQARATVVGVGIVIEKAFQPGGELLRKRGVNLKSLAMIKSISNGKVLFA